MRGEGGGGGALAPLAAQKRGAATTGLRPGEGPPKTKEKVAL
jgi:hypothetical protein